MSDDSTQEIINVGSARLADDGECIRDAFVKINNKMQSKRSRGDRIKPRQADDMIKFDQKQESQRGRQQHD